jgi:hypothetical protein
VAESLIMPEDSPFTAWAPYWSMKTISYRVKAYSSEALENAMFPE